MGNFLEIGSALQYFNTTLTTYDNLVDISGFGGLSYADILFENLTMLTYCSASLGFSRSEWKDSGNFDPASIHGAGFGSFGGINIEFDENYLPSTKFQAYFSGVNDAAYGFIDTSFYINNSDAPTFKFFSTGLLTMQNFRLDGTRKNILDANLTNSTYRYTNIVSQLSGVLDGYQSEWLFDGWADEIDFYMSGAFSGLDTTIECRDNTCTIECDGAHSCYGLTLNCSNQAQCYVTCNQTAGIWCPLGSYTLRGRYCICGSYIVFCVCVDVAVYI